MRRIVLGAGIGAVLVFLWGFLFWAALPLGDSAIQGVTNNDSAQKSLAAMFGETGVYMVPYAKDQSDPAFQTLHKQGPIATVYFRAEGSEPMAPSTFVMGLVHEFVVLLVMGFAVAMVGGGFASRFGVGFLAGTAGSMFAHLGGPIWWLEPWRMAWVNVGYEVVAWLLGALCLAWFIKPQQLNHSEV